MTYVYYLLTLMPEGVAAALRMLQILLDDLEIPMITSDKTSVGVGWPAQRAHDSVEAAVLLTLTVLDPVYSAMRYRDDYDVVWLAARAPAIGDRGRQAISKAAADVSPLPASIELRKQMFTNVLGRVITRHNLTELWNGSTQMKTYRCIEPVDIDDYAKKLSKLDTADRAAGMLLLGLYNSHLGRKIAKRRLRIGAVAALQALCQPADRESINDFMRLIAYYPGW